MHIAICMHIIHNIYNYIDCALPCIAILLVIYQCDVLQNMGSLILAYTQSHVCM